MFVTHEPFRFPIQFQGSGTTWQSVELMLQSPWLLITVEEDDEGPPRTFFLDTTETLLRFLESPTLGRPVGVQLVLPPQWSPSAQWQFVHICSVYRELRAAKGKVARAVLLAKSGQQYGGYPIEETVRDMAELALFCELQ